MCLKTISFFFLILFLLKENYQKQFRETIKFSLKYKLLIDKIETFYCLPFQYLFAGKMPLTKFSFSHHFYIYTKWTFPLWLKYLFVGFRGKRNRLSTTRMGPFIIVLFTNLLSIGITSMYRVQHPFSCIKVKRLNKKKNTKLIALRRSILPCTFVLSAKYWLHSRPMEKDNKKLTKQSIKTYRLLPL